ncbi:aromatic amino acid transaminase [Novosphingobium mangrovi (ex Hu et al. 2023)]|uniref:Aromatic amino acid transaminase n=1 Tax=Novosphingobium mangrovi (ex Hu et al. 2023) TaxID=2930094 RepID=A0ABT0AG20_9SPHN|nr:aromatic amino acid transaminase [Novosphingobium mangrovi (ex Hu et al. 2023)]MCJ1962129.1 aromatic amino acid transaminase [Novosphingobium mangrovi (ex Hu et al. 2023)]
MSTFLMQPCPDDPILSLIGMFRDDPRSTKIDLSVGVFRNEEGQTPVLHAVKQAESHLVATQPTKTYLGPVGNTAFTAAVARMAFGEARAQRLSGLQTPGGTGALRVAADLLARNANTGRIWIGLPTWSNHIPVFEAAGLEILTYGAIDIAAQRFDLDALQAALAAARPGDAVLLQGCCHNPTGIDPDSAQWAAIAALLEEKGLLPLIDLAYQGLGRGISEDGEAAGRVLDTVPDALVAYSCNKNFGLYRERVGALFIQAENAAARQAAASNAADLVRANYSMPPDHGAAVVACILGDAQLTQDWKAELEAMRTRLATIRNALAEACSTHGLALEAIARQRGMFSRLALAPSAISALREEHAIYMAPDGRINLAGLAMADVARLAAALARECAPPPEPMMS